MQTSLEAVQEFLAHKRIAMVGVSRNTQSFSVKLFQELYRRGYDVVPVNPHLKKFRSEKCYARVQDIQPPVAAALLMTSPEATESVVYDCAEAGINLVWMYRAGGRGAVSAKAVQFCQQLGIRVIPGECPLMFLPGAGTVHRLHGWIRKITGRYPRHSATRAA
jgi:predicted CoA-binding protein